jgi:7-carboxy-7-deazaguanine synthase
MEAFVRIYSIFSSVDGEVNNRGIGAMTTFVRFAGCSAACSFCDTDYAKSRNSGTEQTVDEVMHSISSFNCKNVTITGGEPFEQRHALATLVYSLYRSGYNISVETNGIHQFSKELVPWMFASWVVDIKKEYPASLQMYMDMHLCKNDFIKMVVGTPVDFQCAIRRKYDLQLRGVKATFAFSPEYGVLTPDVLLGWMKQYRQTDAVLNIQLHKILNLTESA